MRETVGEITLDPESNRLLCKTLTTQNRIHIASVARKLSPNVRVEMDGKSLLLDIRTGVVLRASRSQVQLGWSEEAAIVVDNFAANYANLGRARHRLRELQKPGSAETELAGYPLSQSLDPHQRVAVAAMTDPLIQGICLFDEQGLGKTVMTIHAFDRLKQLGECDALLIFAPKNMLEIWKKEFTRFMEDKFSVLTITGQRAEKYDQLLKKADVYITNYETAHLLEQPLRSFLLRRVGRVVLAVDESFLVKNGATKRAAAVRKLRHLCRKCWVLCGTPAPNNALDVVHQFDVADGGVTFSGIKLPDNPDSRWLTIKQAVELRGIYLRRLKQDVYTGLLPKRFERVMIPMETDQRRIYVNSLSHLITDVESTDEQEFRKRFSSFLARRMTLFQICSHPGQVVPTYQGVPGKLSALDDLLGELIGRKGEKVVLWSFFRYSLDQLLAWFQKYNPVRIDGRVAGASQRAEAVERFQKDDNTMLFIGNPAAAGAGITLTRSCTSIYESFSVQTAHYLQSLDRIHRRGQTRETNYYILLCKDSIEETEYDRLLMKERRSQELLGDPQPNVSTRQVFLDQLLATLRKM